jgi:uncharacterized protein with GYD domain
MAKYLFRLQYTQAGLEGTIREGFAAREAFFRQRVISVGGRTEAAYWAAGEDDVFIIVDLPDLATATGLSLALARTGAFRVNTTALLTAEDMDNGVARSPSYRAPGE